MKNKKIREWKTGANRDTMEGKIDFEGFLNPLVLEAYAKYMDKHRVMADGTLRASDNWQNLFGDEHLDVCMKSAWRHFHAWWMEHRGYQSREGVEDAICGVIFNAQAYLLKILKEREINKKNTKILLKKREENTSFMKRFWP